MPSLADLTRTFASEDLDPDLAKQLEPLFRYLNANFGAIKDAIGGGLLGIADNLFCEIVTAGFTHNTPQYIGLRKLQTAAAALVLRADGQAVVAAPEVVMSGDRKAKVTLRFNDPTATNVSVVLLMLTEGNGARATAAVWADPILKSLLTTTGDLIYASAPSTPARLAAGTSGYVLTSGGAGVAPAWAAAAGGVTTRTTPDASDVIVWKLDEAAAPFLNSGSGGALSLSQIAGTAAIREGWVGQLTAPMFTATGTRNGLKTGNTSIGESNSLSLSCWFRRIFFSDSSPKFVAKNYNLGTTSAAPFYGVHLGMDAGSQVFQVGITIGGSLSQIDTSLTGDNIVNGSWYHGGFTYDAVSGVLTIYLNGAAARVFSLAPGNIDWGNHGAWFVGETIDGAGQCLEGQVQDVRIANVVRPLSYFQTVYRAGMTR